MRAVKNISSVTSRTFFKDYVFIVLVLLYVFGPLEYVASFAPTLWSLPAIFVLAGVVWNAIEAKISRKRVESKGRAIFISGCDSGFGFELAKQMSSKGFDVYAGCLFPGGDGAETLAKIANVSVVDFDVTKENNISDAVAKVKQRLGSDNKKLWGVVANAGIPIVGPFEWSSMDEIKKVFDVNVFGVIRTAQAFIPLLKQSRGRFVITGSTSGITSHQLLLPYSMSKAAVCSLAEGLRRELGPHSGVFFSSILPTLHKTSMLKDASCEEIEKKFRALPDEKRQEISPGYLSRCKREHAAALRLLTISDLSRTLECFDHALTSTRPRPYYICDRPLLLYTMWPIIQHFPVETADFLFQQFNRLGDLVEYLFGRGNQRGNKQKAA